MFKIMKNSWLIFKKTPGYIHSMTTFPIMMLLLMSVVLAYSNSHNISVIDKSKDGSGTAIYEALNNVDGIKIIKVDEEKIAEKILSGNIEMAVMIEDKGETNIVVHSGGSEVEGTVKEIVKVAQSEPRDENVKVEINSVKKKGITLSNSLGIMLFKFITASSTLAGLLIRERNNRMRGRIFLSGISPASYLSGKSVVYLGSMTFTALVYYIFALVFNFDFGMRNTTYFFLMIVVTNIFSIGVFTFLSTIIKEEGTLWSVGTFIFFPMALLSGTMFPYNSMPDWMQKIGSYVPQRWISGSIEAIQKQDSIAPALPYIGLLLGIAVVFYLLGIYNTGKIKKAA